MYDRGQVSFFYMQICNFPRTIYWRLPCLHWMFLAPLSNISWPREDILLASIDIAIFLSPNSIHLNIPTTNMCHTTLSSISLSNEYEVYFIVSLMWISLSSFECVLLFTFIGYVNCHFLNYLFIFYIHFQLSCLSLNNIEIDTFSSELRMCFSCSIIAYWYFMECFAV